MQMSTWVCDHQYKRTRSKMGALFPVCTVRAVFGCAAIVATRPRRLKNDVTACVGAVLNLSPVPFLKAS